MRLSTLVFVALGLAAFVAVGWVFWTATAETREWRELTARSGDNLAHLPPQDYDRLKRVVLKRLPPHPTELYPRWVLSREQGAERRTLVLISITPEPITDLRYDYLVCVFDQSRRLRSSARVKAGVQENPTGARWVSLPELGPWGFEITSSESFAHQYYDLIDDTPVLVRLETQIGISIANDYEYPTWRIGPALLSRSPTDWERSLGSQNIAEVLGTLTWLGGKHASDSGPAYGRDSEDRELFYKVRSRPGVLRRIEDLRQSPYPWVAEAAAQAKAAIEK